MSIGSQAFHICQDVIHVTSMYVTHRYHVWILSVKDVSLVMLNGSLLYVHKEEFFI